MERKAKIKSNNEKFTKLPIIQVMSHNAKQGEMLDNKQRREALSLYEKNKYNFTGSHKKTTLYHCHLSYKWVACWQCEGDSITIEVYYAGSRENAPY